MSIAVDESPLRVRLENIGWETFEALLRDLGDHRWRVTYDEGVLEFMSPYREHELLKTLIGRFIEALTLELGIPLRGGGSTTFKRRDLLKGVEPDECYYIASELAVRANPDADLTREPPPDLVVEVDVASSSARRLNVYAAMGVPEAWVWRHEGERLTILRLRSDATYEEAPASAVLPQFPVDEATRLLARRHAVDDTALVRAFVERVRRPSGEGRP